MAPWCRKKIARGIWKVEPFLFFQLPREIRDRILFYFCVDRFITKWKQNTARWFDKKPRKGDHNNRSILDDRRPPRYPLEHARKILDSLTVSHQFYGEAIAIFYASSKFRIFYIWHLWNLWDRLPIVYQQSIRELELDFWVDDADIWRMDWKERAATHFSGLRGLRIWVTVPTTQYGVFEKPFDASLQESSSDTFPFLREAMIGIRHCKADKFQRHIYVKEDVDRLCHRLAECLR